MIRSVPEDVLHGIMRRRATAVGSEIARRRLAAGIGPTVFCELIGGVSLQTLHRIEHGQSIPKDHHKAAIALVLDVELDELYPWPSNVELVEAAA